MVAAPFALILALAPSQKAAEAPPAAAARAERVVRLKQVQAVQDIAIEFIQPIQPGGFGGMPGPGGFRGGVPLPAPGGAGTTSSAAAPDLTILQNARLSTKDDDLVDFFRKRTPPAPPRSKIEELVKDLSAKGGATADAAQAHLTAIGTPAAPALRRLANNLDEAEGCVRAKAALANIEGPGAAPIVINAARLLAERKPAKAGEVLVAYLPYAEDDATFDEIEAALVAVAVRDGKADPAVLKALVDPVSLRRAAAAQALTQAGGPLNYKSVRPLLKDKSPAVRLRAGLGLVNAFDAEAVPVLIDLLGDLPPRLTAQAEDYLTTLAGEWAVVGPKGNDAMSKRLRREVWLTWWNNADGDKLLNEDTSRTPSDEDRVKIAGLIEKLGDTTAEVREKATTDLIGHGAKATGLLRRAAGGSHPRIGPFAAKVLESIEKDNPAPMPGAVMRLLSLRKPKGAAEAILNYAPVCEADDLHAQLVEAAGSIGATAGKGDPAFLKALESDSAERRALAAIALTKAKATENLPELKRALDDKDATVRLRTAQGLVGMGERDGVPTLIGLIKTLPGDMVGEAEETLTRIAEDKAPAVTAGVDKGSRTAAHDAWKKWWDENEKTAKMPTPESGGSPRDLGYYVIAENWSQFAPQGRVLEVDGKGKIRWEIKGLQWPNDAQVLRNGNVLVVEQQNRVRELDKKGNVVGMNAVYQNPFHAERLPNGHTFIACRNQLMVVDAKQKQIVNVPYFNNTILGAKRFKDGSMALVSYSGDYRRYDRNGKEVKQFQIQPWVNFGFNGAEVLPGDRVVVSSSQNKVMEYGSDGKVAWEFTANQPMTPSRASNGNILVGAAIVGTNNTVIYELDRRGKLVREMRNENFRTFRVTRR